VADGWSGDGVYSVVSCPAGFDLGDPAVREACATRDIARIFRLLRPCGLSQRQIAARCGMSESEVSEILAGRQVRSYDVFVRIAEGVGIPRGMMGLATGEHHEVRPVSLSYVDEEEAEAVKRRGLLSVGMAMVIKPTPAYVKPVAAPDVPLEPPVRVGLSDVRVYEATVERLVALDRRVGGVASREPLVAVSVAGERLLGAQVQPAVHDRLRYVVAEAHRSAAWASGDAGLMDACRSHAHRALDLVEGDRDRIAQVLCTVGSAEKAYGDVEYAVQVFQVAQMAAAVSRDPQVGAALASEIATGYDTLGYPDKARRELETARRLFGEAEPGTSLPCFASYGNGHGALAAAEQQLGNYDAARTEGMTALQLRPGDANRCNALDTVILATTSIRAGELREGVEQASHALALVHQVGSRRVRARLRPLVEALASRNDSTCRDLARAVHTVAAM
jgi:transcriptional regulator with XRE-family HTH domain/tetratricopeptide (TPR) repeat protein